MTRAELEQRLRGFGLSGQQARVYLEALELGPLTGAQLAEKARVPRSKVYEVCQALFDKGLLEPESRVPRRFRALPLGRLVEQRKSQFRREVEELEMKHREVEGLLSQVVARPEPAEGGLAVLQGEARVAAHLQMMVRGAEARIHVLLADGSLSMLGRVMEEKPPTAEVRVVHRLLREDMPRARRLAERGAVLRHGNASIPITSVTSDGNHSLVLIHPQQGEAPSRALWSSEPSLVAAEEARFALAWKNACTLAQRETELRLGREAGTTELLRHEGDQREGLAVFAAACVAALAGEAAAVDLALGAPFLGVAEDPQLRALLARHRARLLVPFPPDPESRAVATASATLGETRQVPPWMGELAMFVTDHASLVASADPATGQFETIIASGEPGAIRWRRRMFEAAWQAAGELRSPGSGQAPLWHFSQGTAEAESLLRRVVSVATKVVEVRGPPAAEALVVSLVEDDDVEVRRLPLPGPVERSVLVGVDDRLLLVLEDAEFSSRGTPPRLQAVGTCVLTDSPAFIAFPRAAPG
jgi:sugar-specific transcriptional regulator TrmB